MKKSLLAMTLLAVVLAACGGKHVREGDIVVPSWACTQTPTYESRTVTEQEYCGRMCTRPVQRKQYSVKVNCEYIEWRAQ